MCNTKKFNIINCLILILASLSVGAKELPNTPISAGEQKQIQKVGQNVLRAMRTAPRTERTQAIEDIKTMQQQIDALTQLETTPILSIDKQDVGAKKLKERKTKVDNAKKFIRARLKRLKDRNDRSSRHNLRTQQYRHSLSVSAIESLDQEITSALELPALEKHKKLRAISKKLRLTKKPASLLKVDGFSKEGQLKETPTIRTRTKHRRDF